MKKLIKIILSMGIILAIFLGVKKLFYRYAPIDFSIEINEETEWDNISEEDREIIENVISLAKDKVGYVYVWGAKGEVVTEERLDELISYYTRVKYPLKRSTYIGKQAFDCSGLTYWTYREVTGFNIGYSTTQQKEFMDAYKVEGVLQPGDLIYEPGHVVMYIGGGRIIHSKNAFEGVKEDSVRGHLNGVAYRPVAYIADKK